MSHPHPDPVRLGQDLPRVDALAKVTGQARYAAEHPAQDLLYGVVVNSGIARGTITMIDDSRARAVPGVVDVITHENRPKMRDARIFYKDMVAPGGMPYRPLHDAQIHYSGQPVALVLAESFEAARYAARCIEVRYAGSAHQTDLLTQLGRSKKPVSFKAGFSPPPSDKGKPEQAFDAAQFQVDCESHSGVEHHNPMELFASTVLWGKDGHLTIYDKTQGSQNSRWYVSHVFGLPKHRVTVRNPYVGGAFGAGLRPQYQLPLAVMGALKHQRSVRVVMTRQQMFTFGHRPETWQRVKLSATADGMLTSIWHEAVAETSRMEDYVEVVVNWSGQLYLCPNVHLGYRLVELDHATPIDMRAPGAAHGVHALEVAMDELSYVLGMDPLQLRLKNYADHNPQDSKPFSTKTLRTCYEVAAARFGWDKRPLQPRQMREGRELIGWGMATGTWDAMQMFARAEAVLSRDGHLRVRSAATDIGTGTYTVMAMIAAERMGLPLEKVDFELGDSTYPVAPIEGGSSHVATVGSAVDGACEKLQKLLFRLAKQHPAARFAKARIGEVAFQDGAIVLKSDPSSRLTYPELLDAQDGGELRTRYLLLPNTLRQRKFVRATHGAVFCEVRVDEELGIVRVTRVVSAIDAGRILNPRTARGQVIGGIVWGISQALHEETFCDHVIGRFMNHDLGEYHVAANADIHDIQVDFVEERDDVVSRIGAKGVGEIGLVGVSAAISNAIYHATGKRLRDTPMTPDKVMR
jgi:xanthine dehydrogenase YagR molybdenum-binding subunit